MQLVRYVPGPHKDFDWHEAFVEIPENGTTPMWYRYKGKRYRFNQYGNETLHQLVARGAWMLGMDPDLAVDEGL